MFHDVLCYDVKGGSGQRPLSVIAPESEGYTGGLVTAVSSGGKSVLYIVPLQVEIDMTPLPPNAEQFQKMPRAQCTKCNEEMPLQVLAVHCSRCTSNRRESSSDSESSVNVSAEENLDMKNQSVVVSLCTKEKTFNMLKCHCNVLTIFLLWQENDHDVEFVKAVQNGEPSIQVYTPL